MFNRLQALAERTLIQFPSDSWKYVFSEAGLFLDFRFQNGGYYCTPVNSSAFAGTGGDGVHFSYLHMLNRTADQSPIVMTVPLGTPENVIVGDNLHEFLCLGCETGYFTLEDLGQGDDRNDFLAGKPTTDETEKFLLQLLIDEFTLKPWSNVEARLAQLEQTYLPLLQFKPRE